MEDRRHHATAKRLLIQTGLALAAVLALSLTLPSHSFAGPPLGGNCSGAGKWVVCEADDEATTPGSDAKPSVSVSGQTSSKPTCSVRKLEPQPPEGSMYWKGKSPKDGAVYERQCKNGPDGAPVFTYFVADGAANVPAVDPVVVAQQAVGKMLLAGPDIASPRAAGKYTVGVPMWMWVNQSATTYGPNTATATAGGVTVTATAKVSKIVWSMGDGASITCGGPGTPYTASEGMVQSPTCGHVYAMTSGGARNGKFPVTATSTWAINWQGGGQAGQLTEVRQTNVQVAVGEVQVVR
ncbi:ATP/GTP-binding protein [Streptomyces sp. NPDC101209]|uniref:ATP/GTP-binding protein n=1 Tax=Streptomyces sp. NPDC101209 TaxID=3366129 RepID=UPI00380F6C98